MNLHDHSGKFLLSFVAYFPERINLHLKQVVKLLFVFLHSTSFLTFFFIFKNVSYQEMSSQLSIRITCLKFTMSFQSLIIGIFNHFISVLHYLLTEDYIDPFCTCKYLTSARPLAYLIQYTVSSQWIIFIILSLFDCRSLQKQVVELKIF